MGVRSGYGGCFFCEKELVRECCFVLYIIVFEEMFQRDGLDF